MTEPANDDQAAKRDAPSGADPTPDNVVRLSDVKRAQHQTSLGDRRLPRTADAEQNSMTPPSRFDRPIGRGGRGGMGAADPLKSQPRTVGRRRVYASSRPAPLPPRPRKERMLFMGLTLVVVLFLWALWFVPDEPDIGRLLGNPPPPDPRQNESVIYVRPMSEPPPEDASR